MKNYIFTFEEVIKGCFSFIRKEVFCVKSIWNVNDITGKFFNQYGVEIACPANIFSHHKIHELLETSILKNPKYFGTTQYGI